MVGFTAVAGCCGSARWGSVSLRARLTATDARFAGAGELEDQSGLLAGMG